MPRNPRVFVEGGIYHVYNRFASGEDVFNDPEVALEFIELLRFVKKRDGWQIFAWTLMSNHFPIIFTSPFEAALSPSHKVSTTSRGRSAGDSTAAANEPVPSGKADTRRSRSMSNGIWIGSFSTFISTR